MDEPPPSSNPNAATTGPNALGWLLRVLLPIGLLAAAYFSYPHFSEKEEPVPPPTPEPLLLETRAERVEPSSYDVMLDTQGLVQAIQRASIVGQVSGRLISTTPEFEAGVFVKSGDLLAEIDPVDFQAELANAQAQLARAEAALAQEEARARQAKLNWEELDFDEAPSELVLREPQLKEARANLASADASLQQAELSLKRTKILAPFDGIVLERLVGIGEGIGPGTDLGTIAATDEAQVRLPLSPRQLALLDKTAFSEKRVVEITDALNPDLVTTTWEGTLLRPEGQLDEQTREVFVIVRIKDPFGIESGKTPLRLGAPVRASFRARTFENVVIIPRIALQGVNRVIEVTGGVVAKHDISPIWTTASELVVRDQFENGADLAITQLPFAPNGRSIRIIDPPEETKEKASADSKNIAEKPKS